MQQSKRTGALLWICCAQFLVAEQIASHAWQLPYSFARNYISDLGAVHCDALICSPGHNLMNASFVLQGILIASGALLFFQRSRPLVRASAALLALCGIGVFVVGLAPEDTNSSLHLVGAATHFFAGGLGIFLMGVVEIREKRPVTGWTSVGAGFIILAATAMLDSRKLESAGAVERVSAYCITLWLVVEGIGVQVLSFNNPSGVRLRR